MPIVRVDVPEWLTQEQRLQIRRDLHGCIERSWFREHIWVAVRTYATEPDERMVIMTVEVRGGRGHEKERTEAIYAEALEVFNRIIGTQSDELISLCRFFNQDDCISGGGQLPPLADATPPVEQLKRIETMADLPD